VTLLPLAFVATTTLTAGWMQATRKFIPMGGFQGYLNAFLIFAMMGCVFVVLGESGRRWWAVATGKVVVGRAA